MDYLINMETRRRITIQDNAKNICFDLDSTLKTTTLRECDICDEFYLEKTLNPDNSESVSIHDPIYILFNQERLDRLGASGIQKFLDSLQPKSDALAELRSQCSDQDLMTMMKSRHLQSPAEILAWCRYMESNIDTFNSEVQALVEAQSVTTEEGENNQLNTE